MNRAVRFLAPALIVGAVAYAAPAQAQNNVIFSMVPTNLSESCVPKATGRVTITSLGGLVENMHVEFAGLPKATDFAFFILQVPTAPFGLSWYMGDMFSDNKGTIVGDFVGRFNVGTFIVAPGVAPAPVTLPDDANKNPITNPVQLYHLGLWFNSAASAGKAGCGTKVTPFNSTHNAGVQVMNTANFPILKGPLLHAP